MMVEYFCAGYVSLKGGKKGVLFLRIRDGEVNENEEMMFSVSRHVDVPVGWILNIKHEKGGQFSKFKYVGEYDDYQLVKKYEIQSIANSKKIDLEQLRKKKKKIREQIESKTIGDLIEWAKSSPTNKKYLKYYLWELF
jgi:hypothetical protein